MNLGVAAFWIFVAAAVVASIWKSRHTETLRHETVRLLIEKGQKIDEAELAKLLNPAPPNWMGVQQKPSKPGDIYRGLRIFGTIIIFFALGLFIVCVWRGMMLGVHERSVMDIATAIPIVGMVGVGLFVASRYVPRPPSDANRGN